MFVQGGRRCTGTHGRESNCGGHFEKFAAIHRQILPDFSWPKLCRFLRSAELTVSFVATK
jgi:hypothetical protein